MNELQPPHALEEKILRRIPWEILLLSLILSAASLFLFGRETALFILAGGGLSALNFIWLTHMPARLFLSGRKKALRSALPSYLLRLVLILAIFFIIIYFFSKKIIAFAAGFSTVMVVFLIEAGAALSRMRKWKN